MSKILLNKEEFPFAKTSEGETLLEQLAVNVKAAEQGNVPQLGRYAYCMAAGAANAEGKAFNFTVDQFIKACPSTWQKQTVELMATPVLETTKKTKTKTATE